MIRVLLVDDQALVRSGFRIILETEPDIEVVGEAADGIEAVRLAADLAPDVICMDVEMPNLDGLEASRRILGFGAPTPSAGSQALGTEAQTLGAETQVTSVHAGQGADAGTNTKAETGTGPGTSSKPAVLILTTFGHERYLFDALAAGVSGFLVKTARAEQLIDAVHELAAGRALLGPDVTRTVMERVAQLSAANGNASSLSAPGPRVGFDPNATPPTHAHSGAVSVPPSAAAIPTATGTGASTTAATTATATPATASSADSDTSTGTAQAANIATRTGWHDGAHGNIRGTAGTAGPARSGAASCPLDDVGLTEREREVLGLLATGASNAEIAAALFVGEATVKTHVSNVLQKLGVRDRIQAVVWAHTRGVAS